MDGPLISQILAGVILGMVGAAIAMLRKKFSATDHPVLKQDKRKGGPILPGARPEMLEVLKKRDESPKR